MCAYRLQQAFGKRYLMNFQMTFSNDSFENLTDETMGSGWISDHKCEFRGVIHSSMICVKHCKGQKSNEMLGISGR